MHKLDLPSCLCTGVELLQNISPRLGRTLHEHTRYAAKLEMMLNPPSEDSDVHARRRRAGKGVFLPALAAMVIAWATGIPLATALHEIDHRYDVTGFVLDDEKQPLANSPVSIRLGKEVIGYQETNAQGHYRIRLHLHDADLGKTLSVKTAAGEGVIRVTLTPGDARTERRHYANFVGGELIEEPLSRSRYPIWLYGAAVALLLAATAAIIISRRHPRRAQAPPHSGAAKRKRRKRKR